MLQTNPGTDTTKGRGLLRAGIAAPVVFAVAVVVAGHFEPGYSHTSQFVSELGAVGAAHPKLFAFGALFVPGLLTVAFALGMYLLVRPHPWLVASSVLAALAGLGRLAGPFFPCDAGCAIHDMSFTAMVHSVAGFLSLTSGTLAPLALAIGLKRRPRSRLWWWSAALGGWPLVLVFVMFGFAETLSFVGVIQRIILAAFYTWVVAVALDTDALRASPARANESGEIGSRPQRPQHGQRM
jgi:hypothetical membrane protein